MLLTFESMPKLAWYGLRCSRSILSVSLAAVLKVKALNGWYLQLDLPGLFARDMTDKLRCGK